MHVHKRAVTLVVVALLVTATFVPVAGAEQPDPGHTQLVPDMPRIDTPRIDAGEVLDIAVWRDRVVLAGSFTQIRDVDGTWVDQPYIAAYDIDTGKLDMSFRPQFDRPIAEIQPQLNGKSLYVAGEFNVVNGVSRRKLVRLRWNGSVDQTFVANMDSRATALAVGHTKLYVGGYFTKVNGVDRSKLAALSLSTGAVDPSLDLPITEGIGAGGTLKVVALELTSDDSKLMVVHTGTKIDGQVRTGAAMVDTTTGDLLPWRTRLFDDNLARVGGVIRVSQGDISPDDSYFAIVSGSGGDRPPISDTVMAFPVAGGDSVEPLWVSRHFDSIYAVAISEFAVYAGGHFRWQEAPGSTDPWPGDTELSYGWNNGQGAAVLGDEVVRRDQIGALDPATGKALNWDPGSDAFHGVSHLELDPRGLLLGHDGSHIAGQDLGRTAFFDFETVPEPTGEPETRILDPITGQELIGELPFTFRGTATSAEEVLRVQLEIKDLGSGQFLQDDGVTWGSWNAVFATLDELNAVETGWSYEAQLPSGNFLALARAFGEDFSSDPTKAQVRFSVDSAADAPPVTRITDPSSGSLVDTATFEVSGTGTDDIGVNSIRIVVRNNVTNDYLQPDGSVSPQWQGYSVDPDNPGDPEVTWTYEVTVPEGEWRVTAASVDTAGQIDTSAARGTYFVFPTNDVPLVTIDAPVADSVFEAGTAITLSGTATDDAEVAYIEVYVRNLQTRQGMQPNLTYGIPRWARIEVDNPGSPTTTWSVTTPVLPPGEYQLRARAYDNFGVRTPSADRPDISVVSSVPGDLEPETLLDFTDTDQDIETLSLTLTGTATDDNGVDRVALIIYQQERRDYVDATGTITSAYSEVDAVLGSPGATSTTFSLTIALPEPGTYSITARAVDGVNQYDLSTTDATARYLVFPGDTDPYAVINSPTDGGTVVGHIVLGGRAFDDFGVDEVEIMVVNPATGQGLRADGSIGTPEWIQAFATNPGGIATNWNYTTPTLPPADYELQARATDSVGQIDPAPPLVTVTVEAP